ncbi:hypothetical protein ACFY2H_19150 [Streptomyces griseofuscus]|uniref:hypothetical protein n=1 Tax=Streptomyces griseofuscus TaxID=146922 RepID=UPI0036B6CA2A
MRDETTTNAVGQRAAALNGQTVSVLLLGGQTLAGTLTYTSTTGTFGATQWPTLLTVNVGGKAQSVRLDDVSAIGLG